MKKYILSISLITLVFSSCGGTIGNIERYKFIDMSTDSLKKVVKKVNQNYPEFRALDSVKYSRDKNGSMDGDLFCTITEDGKKYLFV